jgi:hypothetical protein
MVVNGMPMSIPQIQTAKFLGSNGAEDFIQTTSLLHLVDRCDSASDLYGYLRSPRWVIISVRNFFSGLHDFQWHCGFLSMVPPPIIGNSLMPESCALCGGRTIDDHISHSLQVEPQDNAILAADHQTDRRETVVIAPSIFGWW